MEHPQPQPQPQPQPPFPAPALAAISTTRTPSPPSLFLPASNPLSTAASAAASPLPHPRSCLMCHNRKIRCDKNRPCGNCRHADLLCCYPVLERRARRGALKVTIRDVLERVVRLERMLGGEGEGEGVGVGVGAGAGEEEVGGCGETRKGGRDEDGDGIGIGIHGIGGKRDGEKDGRNGSHSRSTVEKGGKLGMLPESQSSEESPTEESPTEESPIEELLLQDGYSSRYFNEVLLSRILEEEQELKSVMGSLAIKGSRIRSSESFDIGPLFSGFNQIMAATQCYHPTRWQATQLWQVFVNNVDPITKIIHVPTTQTAIFAAINNPTEADEDINALLFSIYFSAASSLTPANAAHLLGQDKSLCLRMYKQGLEQSLTSANVLETPSMRSLQAMTIYLTSLRSHSSGRSIWTLNGLVIRSAQSIGLHRDGTNFHLSPFECELRRRLWWSMYSIDSRAVEDHGITLGSVESTSDTRFPSNLNDSDISPAMTALPPSKKQWTEMTNKLVMIEVCAVRMRLYRTPTTSSDPGKGAGAAGAVARNKVLTQLEQHLEEAYLKHCDPNIPLQKATLLAGRVIVQKMAFVIRRQWLAHPQPSPTSSPPSMPRRSAAPNGHLHSLPPRKQHTPLDSDLSAALQILQMNHVLQTEELLQGYRWLFVTYPQYHILTYVLWHLCLQPDCQESENAWKLVDQAFETAGESTMEAGPRWAVLTRLREKAWAVRVAEGLGTAEEIKLRMGMESGGGMGEGTDAAMGEAEAGSASQLGGEGFVDTGMGASEAAVPEMMFGNGTWGWDLGAGDFPDWGFADNFEVGDGDRNGDGDFEM